MSGRRSNGALDPLRKSRRSCRQSAHTPSTQVVADASLDRVQMTPGQSGARLFAEDLFHRLALGEFVDEFVEVADLAHHRLLNLLHADAAYDAGDQKARRVHTSARARKNSQSSSSSQTPLRARLGCGR